MSNPQVEAMKALLSHPKNKKLFREAAASPVGSTKREQARRVLSIMGKMQKNYDGAGGAANMYQEYTQASAPKAPAKPYEPQSVVIFHKLPKMCVNFDGNPWKDPEPEPVADGAGGPTNIYDGAGGSVSDWFSGALDTFASAAGQVISPIGSALGTSLYDLSKSQDVKNPTPIQSVLAAPSKISDSITSSIGNAAKAVGSGVIDAAKGVGAAVADGYNYLTSPQYDAESANQNVFNPNLSPQLGLEKPAPTIGPVQPGQSNPNSFNPNLSPQVGVTEATVYAAKNPVNPTNPGVQPLTDDVYNSWFKKSTTTPAVEGPSLPSNKQTDSSSSYSSGYTSQQQNSGTQGTPGQHGSAAKNISASLGISDLSTPFTPDFIKQVGYEALRNAFKTNEGGSVEGVVNNPGNIKYAGLPGQVDSGVKAADGGTFASYATIDEGNAAIDRLLDAIASGKSSYGESPTLGSVADRYTNTGASSGGYASQNNSGSNPSAAAAVASNLGKSGFAWNQITNPNDPITGGQTAAQRAVADEKSAWDQFKIGELQQKQADLRAAGANIPEQVADYIRGRDTYIKETDKMIDQYVDKASNNSDPLSRQSAADHLNYLYTLRGMQNKSYIEYLNSAVNQNKNQLQEVTDAYTIAMNGYTKTLAQKNSLTKEMYDSYSTALQDMYTEVKEAPERALGIQKIQMEIAKGYADIAADAAKNGAQNGYLKDAATLKDYINDDLGYTRPGLNLVDSINELLVTDKVPAVSIVQNYLKGLENTLNANSEAKTKDGAIINTPYKIKIASDAIQQLTNFANTAFSTGNYNSYSLGVNKAQNTADKLANLIAPTLNDPAKVTNIKKAITSLSPSGSTIKFLWTKPTQAKFIENLTASGIDTGVATALYNQYLRYTSPTSEPIQNAALANISGAITNDQNLIKDPAVANIYTSLQPRAGGSPDSFVHALLYNDTDTSGRANPTPLNDQELVNRIAGIYAQDILFSALAGVPAGSGTTLSQ